MKVNLKSFIITATLLFGVGCFAQPGDDYDGFVRIDGENLRTPDGNKLLIRGTNLGNWLNPEGYMFGFKKTNSPRFINEMLCQLVGTDVACEFWQNFKDNYITLADIRFIKSTGANTIRLPFHYKLFTDEDYMGLTSNQDGFERIDRLVEWCRQENLYLILDMHDAPGGQTGDNIDDSYGYPWLFTSPQSQALFCKIWQDIARHYCNEPVILGYELLNEPIAPYFEEDLAYLNGKLEEIYLMAVNAIRKVDENHIILLGGAQWNSNFKPLTRWDYDSKLMFTCHRYGGEPTAEAIAHFIEFRNSTHLPMYMGEIGHGKDQWMHDFVKTMEDNNIGWTFWPYKKVDGSSFVAIKAPEMWNDSIVAFSEASRTTYQEIRQARPQQEIARKILSNFITSCKFENCQIQKDYIAAIGLKAE